MKTINIANLTEGQARNLIAQALEDTHMTGLEYTDDDKLVDLGVDSLDFIELIMYLEEEIDKGISNEVAERMITIGDVLCVLSQEYCLRQAAKRACDEAKVVKPCTPKKTKKQRVMILTETWTEFKDKCGSCRSTALYPCKACAYSCGFASYNGRCTQKDCPRIKIKYAEE